MTQELKMSVHLFNNWIVVVLLRRHYLWVSMCLGCLEPGWFWRHYRLFAKSRLFPGSFIATPQTIVLT